LKYRCDTRKNFVTVHTFLAAVLMGTQPGWNAAVQAPEDYTWGPMKRDRMEPYDASSHESSGCSACFLKKRLLVFVFATGPATGTAPTLVSSDLLCVILKTFLTF